MKLSWYVIFGFVAVLFSCSSKNSKQTESLNQPLDTLSVEETDNQKLSWNSLNVEFLPVSGYYPVMTPNGEYMVFTNSNYDSLWISNLSDYHIELIVPDRGAGYNFTLSDTAVAFKPRGVKKVQVYNFQTKSILESNFNSPLEWSQFSKETKITSSISSDLSSVIINNGQDSTLLNPFENSNYIYAIISPDQENLLIKAAGRNAVITNLKGEIIKELGDISNPTWLNSQTVAFIEKTDDGMQTLTSNLYLMNLENNQKTLVDLPVNTFVESISYRSEANLIVGHTTEGKIFIVSNNL